MERGGFEPPKAEPADLQSAPFDHSGTSPNPPSQTHSLQLACNSAGEGTRTRDLLITNQLLYQLSYASKNRIKKIKEQNGHAKIVHVTASPQHQNATF
jgi:hypothetical protein